MKTKDVSCNAGGEAPIKSLQSFCREIGVAPITAWRYRKRGWLQTVNIAGRQYLTAEAAAEFKRRALAGEFAKAVTGPKRAQTTPP